MVAAQEFVSLVPGSDLNGWKVEHSVVEVRDGVMRVGTGNGWVRTEQRYADFVLKLDVRLGPDARGGIFVRGWPTFDDTMTPTNAYGVTLTSTASSQNAWRHMEVECVGRTLLVRLDGTTVYRSETIENPQGHLALWSSAGSVEFRAIEINHHPLPKWEVPVGVYTKELGAVLPKPLVEVKPQYTAEATNARISGTVILSAIVASDGKVKDVVVRRSLDPKYGLDRAAVKAASEWKFSPGTYEGRAVSVFITISLAFYLK